MGLFFKLDRLINEFKENLNLVFIYFLLIYFISRKSKVFITGQNHSLLKFTVEVLQSVLLLLIFLYQALFVGRFVRATRTLEIKLGPAFAYFSAHTCGYFIHTFCNHTITTDFLTSNIVTVLVITTTHRINKKKTHRVGVPLTLWSPRYPRLRTARWWWC